MPVRSAALLAAAAMPCLPADACLVRLAADAPAAAPAPSLRVDVAGSDRRVAIRACVDRPVLVTLSVRRGTAVEGRDTAVAGPGCVRRVLPRGRRAGRRIVVARAHDAAGRLATARVEVAR